ncbi:MAG TPA: hypothetical protein HA362_05040 [Nanoarchaeota archaeon]|nr:hypothetical protein [Nanoarchaeota archaeon]
MKAGVDFGTTLVKAVWNNRDYRFASTADYGFDEIMAEMKADGIRQINAAGINTAELQGFEIHRKQGDIIENEIKMQANGARELLRVSGSPLEKFLLVSIGTGTSYTFVDKTIEKCPFGNSISGGFMLGLGKLLGAKDCKDIETRAMSAEAMDLKIKDIAPEKAGTFEGELVIASFGKKNITLNDAFASIVHTVAVATVRDVALIGRDFNNVAYIGTPIGKNKVLKNYLEAYTMAIGRKPYFPEKGEYSLALGAFLEAE